jgi:hypothetical protein
LGNQARHFSTTHLSLGKQCPCLGEAFKADNEVASLRLLVILHLRVNADDRGIQVSQPPDAQHAGAPASRA